MVHDDRRRRRDDPLDPCSRHAASLAPPVATPAPPEAAGALSAVKTALCIEQLLPDLVRRIAWTGNGRKGTVRLEFGAGALEGATLLVHSDEGRVRVELFAPPGTDVSAWRQRIASRLRGRGIPLDEIDVV